MPLSDDELMAEFLAKGIVKIPVESMVALAIIKKALYDENFDGENLNDFRLEKIRLLNAIPDIKKLYFLIAQHAIETLVGNELVMQRNINLSIQLPGDASSLLPIHCDTWSGDSSYEVVLWVPLVDCHGTKSMFFCDKDFSDSINNLSQIKDAEELYQHVKPHAPFIDCKYGECLIFTQNIMHGNRVNETNETRWSLNCRFKSALTPYADKKIGEFFEPITIRPATRLGAAYVLPRL